MTQRMRSPIPRTCAADIILVSSVKFDFLVSTLEMKLGLLYTQNHLKWAIKLLQVGLLLYFINYYSYTPFRDGTLSSSYSTQFFLYK